MKSRISIAPQIRLLLMLGFGLLLNTATASPLVLEGLDGRERDNVLAFMGYADASCDSPAWRLRALYAQAEDNIRQGLEAFGYYRPQIESELVRTDDCLQARFKVTPGEPVRYREVQFEIRGPGADADHWQAVRDANPLQPGEPLQHADYAAYRQRIENTARRFGYFSGEFLAREITVKPAAGSADVELIYNTGPRYRFSAVEFEQDVIADELLRRFVDFAPGDPFNADHIAELYEALLLSGYFSTVDIRTEPQRDGSHTVRTVLTAAPSKASTWTAGLGFGTDTGPQVQLGYLNRRRNSAGHQWSANGSASQVIKEAGVGYRIPLDNPESEWLYGDLGYKDEDTDTSDSRILKAGIKRQQQRRGNWLETQFIDMSNENFELADSAGSVFLLVPGISWSRLEVSDLARPRRGYRLSFQVSGSSEAIGSDLTFAQTLASAKIILPLPAGFRLLSRAEVATTWLEDLQELPASLRYFAGGDFSVRGYDYKALGPRADDGTVTGGDNLLTASVEIDRALRGKWSVAAFADTGNAFNSFSDMNLQLGVGAGVRWYSPVGPIRFDLAFPVSSDITDDRFRVHVTLSPDL